MKDWIHEHWPHIFVIESSVDYFKLAPENDFSGNVEYKRTLVDCNETRIQKYITQMMWRIMQSSEQVAVYYLGVDDDGSVYGLTLEETKDTILTFMKMTSNINAIITNIHLIDVQSKWIVQIKIKLSEPKDIFYSF